MYDTVYTLNFGVFHFVFIYRRTFWMKRFPFSFLSFGKYYHIIRFKYSMILIQFQTNNIITGLIIAVFSIILISIQNL